MRLLLLSCSLLLRPSSALLGARTRPPILLRARMSALHDSAAAAATLVAAEAEAAAARSSAKCGALLCQKDSYLKTSTATVLSCVKATAAANAPATAAGAAAAAGGKAAKKDKGGGKKKDSGGGGAPPDRWEVSRCCDDRSSDSRVVSETRSVRATS